MRSIWGAVTEISDLGVVAEHCPHCERLMSCLLRSVCRGDYVLFVKMTAPPRESTCLCTGCLKAFPCDHFWRYAAVVPIQEAKTLPLEDLLARTNPVLAERLKFKEQVRALGGDARFAIAYEHLEAMRPGALRSDLLRQLLDWDRLEEEQRALLGQQIATRARAWQLARHLAPGFPRSAGCLTVTVAVLLVAQTFLWLPAIRDWLRGSVAVAASVIVAMLFNQKLFRQAVRRWTRKVLIPESQDANVSLDCFLAVVDDIPGSRLGLVEDLWPMKDQLETIRGVLVAEGKL
jgi:hypothetical protein